MKVIHGNGLEVTDFIEMKRLHRRNRLEATKIVLKNGLRFAEKRAKKRLARAKASPYPTPTPWDDQRRVQATGIYLDVIEDLSPKHSSSDSIGPRQ